VNRGDRGLDVILREFGTRRRKLQELQSLDYKLLVPLRAILIQQGAQIPQCIDSRREARRIETHQRSERIRRGRRPERVFQKYRRQAHRLPAQPDVHRCVGRSAVIALVKEQVEGAVDGWKTCGEFGGGSLQIGLTVLAEEPRRRRGLTSALVSGNLPLAMANQSAVWTALGDTTRRAIFERLADRPQTVGELARKLPVTRPAVSQHLKVLKDAGLVVDRRVGNRRIYKVNPDGVGALRAQIDRFWSKALATYKEVAEQPTKRNSHEN
jgi:DNA-binding transcriptional ArsR family regulator